MTRRLALFVFIVALFIILQGPFKTPVEAAHSLPRAAANSNAPQAPFVATLLHFHGNPTHAETPDESSCTGTGSADVVACDGPFLLTSGNLAPAGVGTWTAEPAEDGTNPRNIYDPQWIWKFNSPVTIQGPVIINFWASCGACSSTLNEPADWNIRIFADPVVGGTANFVERVTATPSLPNVAEKLTITVNVPSITAQNSFLLQVDPVFGDTQQNTHIYYDSALPCPTSTGADPCDSTVSMPVGGVATSTQTSDGGGGSDGCSGGSGGSSGSGNTTPNRLH